MGYRIKGLGWLPDPPDCRDLGTEDKDAATNFAMTAAALRVRPDRGAGQVARATAPKKVDLRALCSPVEDQGNIGSCTAHAVCGLIEYLERTLYGEHLNASRLFLYKATRSFLGWKGDSGAFVRSTIKALRLFGVPPEDYWAYDETVYDDDPSPFCYAFAGNYKAVQYYRLKTLEELRKSLANGIPFAFGFTCYSSLFSAAVRKSGNIPYPKGGEKVEGGHAVMAVGYDDEQGRLIIRNSWGTGWGDEGYGTLPYEFVERGLAQDFWALVKMDMVHIDDASPDRLVEDRSRMSEAG